MAPLLDIPIEIVAAVVTVATLLAMTATTVFQIRSLYKPGNRSIRLILLVGNTIGFLMFVSYTSAIYLSDSVIIKLCTHWLLLLTVWFAIMIILETLHLFSAITASITTTRIRVLQALSTGALLVAWGGGYVRYIVYFEKTDPRWFARWHAVGLNFVLGGVAAADTIQNIWIVHKLYRFVEARIASGKVSREDNFRLRFYVTVGWLVLLMLSDALSMGFNIMSLLLKSADKILAERLACALAQISASLFILHYSVSLTVNIDNLTTLLFGSRDSQGSTRPKPSPSKQQKEANAPLPVDDRALRRPEVTRVKLDKSDASGYGVTHRPMPTMIATATAMQTSTEEATRASG